MSDCYRIEIDARTCDMTMKEVMEWVGKEKKANPDREYWLDGDAYAIVSKRRCERMEVDGIHMVHNRKVADQRAKAGKEVYTSEPHTKTVDLNLGDGATKVSEDTVKTIWAAIYMNPAKTRSELVLLTGYSGGVVYSVTKELMDYGLIINVEPSRAAAFEINSKAKLPVGWVIDQILADAKPRLDDPESYRVRRGSHTEQPENVEIDSSLASILANTKPILPSSVGAYKEFYEFIQGAPATTQELKTIVSSLKDFCQYRMTHVSIDCPLCKKGKLVRNGFTAFCPKCKASATMGSFEASVRAMQLLADSKGDQR